MLTTGKIAAAVLLVASAGYADAFSSTLGLSLGTSAANKLVATSPTSRTSAAAGRRITMQLVADIGSRPAEVIFGTPLPRVYVYDHCPFCVRVRAIFGLKNIKHEVRFMANDDIPTPTALVGKKIAPILEIPTLNEIMMESLDIVKRIDEDPAFGPSVLKPSTGRKDTGAWAKKYQDLFRSLQRPRYVSGGLLPEFAMKGGRDAFVKNHPVPPFEKPEWKSDSFTMEQRYKHYADAMAGTPKYLAEANQAVKELEPLIHCADHCSPEGLGYDDIELFARLRSLTIIKGLELPPKTKAYMETMSRKTDIPLYDQMAI